VRQCRSGPLQRGFGRDPAVVMPRVEGASARPDRLVRPARPRPPGRRRALWLVVAQAMLVVALGLLAPPPSAARCTAADLAAAYGASCAGRYALALRRCLRAGLPLAACDTSASAEVCERVPAQCRPTRDLDAIAATVYPRGPVAGRCRASLAFHAARLVRIGRQRGRAGTLSNLPRDLAACVRRVLSGCGTEAPQLAGPCGGVQSAAEAARCVCRLGLPALPVTAAFRTDACPSRLAPASCAVPPAPLPSCAEAFVEGGPSERCTAANGSRVFYNIPDQGPADGGRSEAWSFSIRPRARQFYGPFPEVTGSVRATSDGLGTPGSRTGASDQAHLRLSSPIMTKQLLLLRWYTAGLPAGAEGRVRLLSGATTLVDATETAGDPAARSATAVVGWQGDLDLSVGAVVTGARDAPVPSADLNWRLAVLDANEDDDQDGVTNAIDPAPLDRTVPQPPPPSSRPKVLVVGLDGAGWDVLDVLMLGGYLPTIAGIVGDGARAPLDETTNGPDCCFCPPVWSGAATGQRAGVHKMRGLLSEPADRPVPAIWGVLAAHGGTSTLASYRNTFPSDPGVTYNLTEAGLAVAALEFGSSGVVTDVEWVDRLQRTWPPLLFESLGVLPGAGPPAPLWLPVGVDRVAVEAVGRIAESHQTDLTMVILHSIDKSEHVTWDGVQFAPGDPLNEANLLAQAAAWTGPITGGCCDFVQGFNWGNVASQNLEADLHLSELLGRVSYDYVMLLSDHAMTRNPYPGLAGHHQGLPPAYHGIFALSGPGVRAGTELGAVSLLDVAPTLAYLLDLPVGANLPGRVVAEAFTTEHLAAKPIQTVPSW
jgi:hypothetical protein